MENELNLYEVYKCSNSLHRPFCRREGYGRYKCIHGHQSLFMLLEKNVKYGDAYPKNIPTISNWYKFLKLDDYTIWYARFNIRLRQMLYQAI